jgi:hypothetical protein
MSGCHRHKMGNFQRNFLKTTHFYLFIRLPGVSYFHRNMHLTYFRTNPLILKQPKEDRINDLPTQNTTHIRASYHAGHNSNTNRINPA